MEKIVTRNEQILTPPKSGDDFAPCVFYTKINFCTKFFSACGGLTPPEIVTIMAKNRNPKSMIFAPLGNVVYGPPLRGIPLIKSSKN